jgi:hypothetical protein
MTASTADRLSARDLEQLLREVEPAALLVPARILRRVIKKDCGLGGLGLRVPHRKSYILRRDNLLAIATPRELDLEPGTALPEVVMLFPIPSDARLGKSPAGEVLLRYWGLLFHLRVHRAFERLRLEGKLDESSVRERIRRIGVVEFEEAREVLHQENFLLKPGPDATDVKLWPGDLSGTYEEFAAVYLELLYFDPHRRQQFFPAITDHAAVEKILGEDIDHAELFRSSRPRGASDPVHTRPLLPPAPEPPLLPDEPEKGQPGEMRRHAEEAARRRNNVRAAILRRRAMALCPPSQAGRIRANARQEIEKLAARLRNALHFPESETADWSRCLLALLDSAALGIWNQEARLLYDLQKVCDDNEREIYAADLVEWMVSWFHRPIKRSLPDQPLILTVKHLRTALGRMPVARIPDAERRRLGELLQFSLHHAEKRLRDTLRPKLIAALDQVGLTPANTAERLSRDKLVEELLDRVVESGHLSIGDIRDALARNRLKLPDLRGPVEFFRGDPLIRVNRKLAADLDGIYHRGEIYLRWMQRFSSLFFGTLIGRFLTLFMILPLLGSLFLLKGIDGLTEEGHKYLGLPEVLTFDMKAFVDLCKDLGSGRRPAPELLRADVLSFPAVALILLLLMHSRTFRHVVWKALQYFWLAIRGLLYDLPAAFLNLPLVRRIVKTRTWILFYQYLGKPAAWTAPLALVLYFSGVPLPHLAAISGGVLVGVSAVINTRLGMLAEEAAADWLVRTWELVRDDLLPGLFHWIMWVSRRVRDSVEQAMYTVDEWLRFRGGQSQATFVLKVVLGFFWFLITYIVRFAMNLLVEPQVNPIKHFPVVTVSHKLMLLLVGPIAARIQPLLGMPLGEVQALVYVFLFGIPGIFGFLAWELKENWRLYRANESPTLDPEMVGSHGEHVINLIRPGFHAGTLPRLYARIRRAKGAAERKVEEGIHHVEEAIRHFVERDLVAVLRASRAWPSNGELAKGPIGLATNRIRLELACPAQLPRLADSARALGGVPLSSLGEEPAWIDFANRGGYLMASVTRPGWLAGLRAGQRSAFRDALAGFYKEAGVDLVDEQIRALIGPGVDYDISHDGLTVWLDAGRNSGWFYDLRDPDAAARPVGVAEKSALPSNARPFLFDDKPLWWKSWAAQWEQDQAGKGHEPPLLGEIKLLPVEEKSFTQVGSCSSC